MRCRKLQNLLLLRVRQNSDADVLQAIHNLANRTNTRIVMRRAVNGK